MKSPFSIKLVNPILNLLRIFLKKRDVSCKLWGVIWVFNLVFFSCKTNNEVHLTIAAASNMLFVLNELVPEFEKETGISTDLITASSGKLTTQILAGAPFDVFISANAKYPKHIRDTNSDYQKAVTIARGKLILISTKKIKKPLSTALTSTSVKKIAMPNPNIAPYGKAAEELLHNWGVYDHVVSKLIYGESVGQTNQFISLGTVDIGFTAKSTLFSNKLKGMNENYAEISDSLYQALDHQLLIVSKTKAQKNKALQFARFIQTKKARQILLNYGYALPE
ncbi:molybdate ABC transporter substrate-binding protein [Aquimarina agarilytica]|uniref:molybdate ABC transporter substrate-binding protein n=1 Tax=Aquimarina agarilytica TaxID=1087449 RepID=UPI00028905F5|nr:molybdate ABC transporter substrate-binding protein [Aquimarina agarilytica]